MNSLKDNEIISLSFFVTIILEKREVFMGTSMNFELFKESIIQIMTEKLGKNYKIFSDTVIKNNGIELTGIVIQDKSSNVSPTIYIDSFFEDYQRGVSIKKVTDAICHIFSENKHSHSVDMSLFTEYGRAKEQIAFKLINYDKNKRLLEKIPHGRFYDLAVVFYYIVKEEPFFGKASILITNAHLSHWGIKEEDFIQNAIRNTPKILPARIENMEDVMFGLLKKEVTCDELASDIWERMKRELRGGEEKIPMYVLSNMNKIQGAACMLYPEILKNFSDKMKNDLYILPSSVHEVILLPATDNLNREDLLSMVTQINATQVEADEVLADSVYYYTREMSTLKRLC